MAEQAGFRWYAARVRAMSVRELAWRGGNAATLPFREARPRSASPTWQAVRGAIAPSANDAQRLARGELELWGRRVDVDLRRTRWNVDPLEGAPLRGRSWRAWGRDPKPVWELHRLQHLVPLALGGDEAARRLAAEHLLDWIARNPRGTPHGWSSGYEVAHRLVGWAVAVPHLLDVLGARERGAVDASFVEHARFVAARPSRYSSANNHRLAELSGLLVAARAGVGSWEPLWRELEAQVHLQTYADGGSREQASGYFLYVLEILWTAGLLAQDVGRPLGRLEERLQSMLRWLDAVADRDGEPPPVGDDAEDRMLRLEYYEPRRAALLASRVGRLLGSEPGRSAPGSVLLPDSGYAVLRGDGLHVVFDVGELGLGSLAAHGHADALAVLASGRLRDSGTGSYLPAEGRDLFRVTAAHNTVTVDDRSQAEPRGPHLWGSRYAVTVEGASFGAVDYVRASHDAYAPARHTRSVTLVPPDLLVVLDRVRAPEPVTATLAWHPQAGRDPSVSAVPRAEQVEVEAPWSPRYRDIRPGRRLTWTARGTDIAFASILGTGELPKLRHEAGVTTVEISTPRKLLLTERWAGPMIESEG